MEEPVVKMQVKDQHLLTLIDAISKKSFAYYTGAAWNKAGRITNSKEWFRYLHDFKKRLENPVVIKWLQE